MIVYDARGDVDPVPSYILLPVPGYVKSAEQPLPSSKLKVQCRIIDSGYQ